MIQRSTQSFHPRGMQTPNGSRSRSLTRIGTGRHAWPGGRAYSSAKLCVVLTARALRARPDTEARRLHVIAYDPGPTPGTGLVRDQGALVRFVWERLGTPLRLIMRKANTIEVAGSTLAALALGTIRPPDGRVYAALRRGVLTSPPLSELARRDDIMNALWSDSAQLVGLGSA
jgi:NAD(P)-dependent dehydrogenase (short-subunit alcohol dehydrogenase family)